MLQSLDKLAYKNWQMFAAGNGKVSTSGQFTQRFKLSWETTEKRVTLHNHIITI